MKIVVDENVSYGLVEKLRTKGHEVISIAESAEKRMSDEDVYALILHKQAVLITRDYHFTNPIRFPTDITKGIIYVRHGSLRSKEEITIVENFLGAHNWEKFQGRLVTLYKDSARIR
jgi:predicted nuclease of predicted toxin-antitoxin system